MVESYNLSTVLETFESLEKKGVDKLKDKVIEKIFGGNLNESNIEEFKKFNRLFGSLYDLMKDKFSEVYRTSGERYFEHLRAVVNNVLDLPNPTLEKVLIALAHDSIEDTNKTFEGLNEDYGYKVALGVQAISKDNWENYLTVDEKSKIDSLEFKHHTSIRSESINKYEDELKSLKKFAKNRRNDDYFGHLESFESLSRHITSIALEKEILSCEYKGEKLSKIVFNGVEIGKEELKEIINEITQDVLDVKLADRIHNLSTQWDPNNLDTVRRKVDETKKYFLDIAKEHNPKAYEKLQSLILKLEIKLHNASEKVEDIIEL